MKSVISFIATIAHKLEKKYSPSISRQYAWWMIEAITHQNKASLLADTNMILSEKHQSTLENWIYEQVYNDMPLQYLIGSVPFGECKILVKPPILIPRPETEDWCMKLIEKIKNSSTQSFSLLDIGTGSGCIALSFAKAFPEAKIYAIDIATNALQLAKKNAKINGINTVTFLPSDLFSAFDKETMFDLIVSNPPYICPTEKHSLDSSVSKWEDEHALFAPQNGLGIMEKIITYAPYFLKFNQEFANLAIPQLSIEIGKNQGEAVASLFAQNNFSNIIIEKDLQGHDRVVSGRWTYETYIR